MSMEIGANWMNTTERENEFSLNNGFRILSSYVLGNGEKVWVITEADRSTTCILLPLEY
jgi:hypothetical protein